jgi:hypothetical protein
VDKKKILKELKELLMTQFSGGKPGPVRANDPMLERRNESPE